MYIYLIVLAVSQDKLKIITINLVSIEIPLLADFTKKKKTSGYKQWLDDQERCLCCIMYSSSV